MRAPHPHRRWCSLRRFSAAGTALATDRAARASPSSRPGLTPGVQLWGITSGPDGNTWFTEENNNAVGRVTPGAVITEFSAGFPTGSPRGIVSGPDGNLWVAQAGGDGAIARVTKTGDVTEFPVPTAGDPNDIAVGPDGNLWYVDPAANVIGRITPEGSITEFTDGLSDGRRADARSSRARTAGSGSPSRRRARSARSPRAGVITEFSSNLSGSDEPADIAAGPDGKLWFTLNGRPGRHRPDHDHGRRHGVQRRPDHELEARSASPPGPTARSGSPSPRPRAGSAASRPRATSPSTPPACSRSRTRGSSPPAPTGTCGSPATTRRAAWRGSPSRRS